LYWLPTRVLLGSQIDPGEQRRILPVLVLFFPCLISFFPCFSSRHGLFSLLLDLKTKKQLNCSRNPFISFRNLQGLGFFQIFERALTSSDQDVRYSAVDLIFLVFEVDAGFFRKFMLGMLSCLLRLMQFPRHQLCFKSGQKSSSGQRNLLEVMAQQFVEDPELGIKTHLFEILRTLLDSDVMEAANV